MANESSHLEAFPPSDENYSNEHNHAISEQKDGAIHLE